MQGGCTFDVVVVGNGVLGSATALALADRDPSLRVALVGDPERRGAASAAAGAMNGDLGEVTRAGRASPFGRAKIALAAEASRRWPAFRARLERGAPPFLASAAGTFVVETARAGGAEAANFDAIVAEASARGARWERVDASGGGAPGPSSPAGSLADFRRALFLPDEGAVDAARLLAALDAALDGASVVRVAGLASGLLVHGSRARGVRLAIGDELAAPRVVLAAGARTQALVDGLPELARAMPRIVAGVGVSLLASVDGPLDHVVRTPNGALATGLHAVPRGARDVYVGASNELALLAADDAPPEVARHLFAAVTEDLLPLLGASRPRGERVGNRPVSVDGYPLLGATSVEGLFVATGTYRDGLHLAPLVAADLAARVLGAAPEVSHPFAPERAPLAWAGRDEAIAEGVEQLTWRLGRGLGGAELAALRASVRARVEAVYARLDEGRVVPADLLLLLEAAPHALAPPASKDR